MPETESPTLDALTDLRITNAFTDFDRRAATRKGYNRYALAHYCQALQNIRKRVEMGATVRQAIVLSFLDRLRDKVLRAVGETDYVRWEELDYPRFDIDDE